MKVKLLFTLIVLFGFGVSSWAQENKETEWIKVYFNMPGDSSVMQGVNISNDSWDLISTLENLIDSADFSVDLAIYDIEEMRVAEALARAKARGVRVRIVTDNHNRTDAGILDEKIWEAFRKADITSIDDDGDVYLPNGEILDNDLVNDGADMHHKFAVIDALSENKNDDYVWTGSTNLTYTGAYNTNNTIVIKDAEVAAVYLEEFEQMWGSDNEKPNPDRALFHKDKRDVSAHIFNVNGIKIEIYFAPINRDGTKPSVSDRIVEVINQEAQSDIRFQAFAITPNIPISKAIWNKSIDTSIQLEGIIDPGFFSRYRNTGAIWGSPEAQLGNRLILPARETRKLHSKLIIVDVNEETPDDEAVIIAGSYNFSNNAELSNDENTIIIFSDEIANQYYQNFKGVMSRAKGKSFGPSPKIDPEKFYEVYAVRDGAEFEIEIVPGFGYPVQLLGVEVPSIYAGEDSAYYFSGASASYLKNLLEGRRVRVFDYDGGEAYSAYNRFFAYVEIDIDGRTSSLNKEMLINGFGIYSEDFKQNEDSVKAFKNYEKIAKDNKRAIWKQESKIGTKVLRAKEIETGSAIEVVYPININTADQATLQLLPGIGKTYASRIIEYRLENKGFSSIEDLLKIKGIGAKRLARIRPLITLY
jgi:competence ComEA-like helix-hairpin-helix protein|tara:strand:- start:3390 stop:5321 length:1932 start_codon:yes stop_codon:yes gene_type:complete